MKIKNIPTGKGIWGWCNEKTVWKIELVGWVQILAKAVILILHWYSNKRHESILLPQIIGKTEGHTVFFCLYRNLRELLPIIEWQKKQETTAISFPRRDMVTYFFKNNGWESVLIFWCLPQEYLQKNSYQIFFILKLTQDKTREPTSKMVTVKMIMINKV